MAATHVHGIHKGSRDADGSQKGHGLRRRLRLRRGLTGTRVSRKWSLQEKEDGTG